MNQLWAYPVAAADAADRVKQYGFGQGQAVPVCVSRQEMADARLLEPWERVAVHAGLYYDCYPWDWLPALRKRQPQAEIIIALDEAVYDSFLLEALCRLAAELNIQTVPAGRTADEIMEAFAFFCGALSPAPAAFVPTSKRGRVVAVWSAASKDGATTAAIGTALSLAGGHRLRVGLIDGNLRNPEIRSQLNLSQPADRTHFQLRPKLQTQQLRPQELLEACVSYRRLPLLHVLPGTPRRDTALDLTPEMMVHLLQTARSVFDITIVDLNAYPDNAATIVTAREADVRWLVAQNHFASYRTSWAEWYDCSWKYCGIAPEEMALIVNRTEVADKPKRVAEALGMPLAAAIPNVPGGLGVKSAHEGEPLYGQPGAEGLTEAMDALAAGLAGGAEAEAGEARRRLLASPGGWLSRWAARVGL